MLFFLDERRIDGDAGLLVFHGWAAEKHELADIPPIFIASRAV